MGKGKGKGKGKRKGKGKGKVTLGPERAGGEAVTEGALQGGVVTEGGDGGRWRRAVAEGGYAHHASSLFQTAPTYA